MYEPPRLGGATTIPPAIPTFTPAAHHQMLRQSEVDPVAIWQTFASTILRRKWLFVGVFAGVFLTVALVTLLSPRKYTTDVKMIAGNPGAVAQNPQQAQTGLPVLNALLLANAAQSAETYAELIGETPVVQHVINDLNLKTDVRGLQSAVRVKPVTNTNILSLQVTWSDPEMSAAIANDFATVFVSREAELVASSAVGALEVIQRQLPDAKQRLDVAENNLSKFQTTHNIVDLGGQTTALVGLATNTDAKINAVQLEKQQADAQIGSLSAQLGQLAKQRSAINPQLAKLPAESAQMLGLQREKKLAEDTYNALQQKFNDATIARTTGISDVTITQDAKKELATKTPHVTTNLAIGAIVALLLALGVVFLVDWFDGRLRDEADVEAELGLPVLASIPLMPSGDGAKAVPANVRNAAMESYFQLVLAMRYSSDRPLRSVTVTSPLKGDGKSTVAMNIAGALGEIAVSSIEREARVLVIDADMRRPSLHKKFDLPNEFGLTDILVGRASLAQAVQRTDRPGVDVLTSGTHSPNPIKLLQSSRFDALLRVPVFDAAILANKTDGTVMILSANHTDRRSTRRAMARRVERRSVWLAERIITVPSVLFARIAASKTGTRSSASKRLDCSSLIGFGECVPLVSTSTPGRSVRWTACASEARPTRMSVSPNSFGRSNFLCSEGRRMSASITSTRASRSMLETAISPSAPAMFIATVDLPSPLSGLVTVTLRSGRSEL